MIPKGSQTERNLLTAFAGESIARTMYTLYANQAAKEGYPALSDLFEETAEHERVHAKRFLKLLEGRTEPTPVAISTASPGSTIENLEAAAGGEHGEWSDLYPGFARTAREEGQEVAAILFMALAVAERHHEERFAQVLHRLKNGTLYRREQPVKWHCRKCGYVHEGTEAPGNCPGCAHPQAWFEVLAPDV